VKNSAIKWGVFLAALLAVVILSGCGGSKWEDGTYTGEGQGNNGPVKVEVTVEGGKITEVSVIEHQETPVLSDGAIEQIPQSIVENQSLEVDTVAGATVTSQAIINAVEAALEAASK
jgi:uncharacterized protein with FMN-binding domain